MLFFIAARARETRFATAGVSISIVAALADLIENACLLHITSNLDGYSCM